MTTGGGRIERCDCSRPARIIRPRTLTTDGSGADRSWVACSTSTRRSLNPQLNGGGRVLEPVRQSKWGIHLWDRVHRAQH